MQSNLWTVKGVSDGFCRCILGTFYFEHTQTDTAAKLLVYDLWMALLPLSLYSSGGFRVSIRVELT